MCGFIRLSVLFLDKHNFYRVTMYYDYDIHYTYFELFS